MIWRRNSRPGSPLRQTSSPASTRRYKGRARSAVKSPIWLMARPQPEQVVRHVQRIALEVALQTPFVQGPGQFVLRGSTVVRADMQVAGIPAGVADHLLQQQFLQAGQGHPVDRRWLLNRCGRCA